MRRWMALECTHDGDCAGRYISNDTELEAYWLKFCKIKELHVRGQGDRYMLAVVDLRLDKMMVLQFDSGFARQDWFNAMTSVQVRV